MVVLGGGAVSYERGTPAGVAARKAHLSEEVLVRTLHPNPQNLNPKPLILNSRPETVNPKP